MLKLKESPTIKIILQIQLKRDFVGYLLLLQIFLITSNISTIWKSVWSSAANKARLKIVVSTQAVNADTTKRILTCENLYTKVDFVAIGPYIDIPLTNTMTNTDIFNGLDNQLRVIKSYLISHANITNGYGIPLSCY